jgi:hypothetical protein
VSYSQFETREIKSRVWKISGTDLKILQAFCNYIILQTKNMLRVAIIRFLEDPYVHDNTEHTVSLAIERCLQKY